MSDISTRVRRLARTNRYAIKDVVKRQGRDVAEKILDKVTAVYDSTDKIRLKFMDDVKEKVIKHLTMFDRPAPEQVTVSYPETHFLGESDRAGADTMQVEVVMPRDVDVRDSLFALSPLLSSKDAYVQGNTITYTLKIW